MPIKIWNTNVKAIYIGNKAVKAVYIGNKKVWPAVDINKLVWSWNAIFEDWSLSLLPNLDSIEYMNRQSNYLWSLFDNTYNDRNVIVSYLYTPSSCDEWWATVRYYDRNGVLQKLDQYNRSSANCRPEYGLMMWFNQWKNIWLGGIWGIVKRSSIAAFLKPNLDYYNITYYSNWSSSYDEPYIRTLWCRDKYIYYAIIDGTPYTSDTAAVIVKLDITNWQSTILYSRSGNDYEHYYSIGVSVCYYDNWHYRIYNKRWHPIKKYKTYILDVDINNDQASTYTEDDQELPKSWYYWPKWSKKLLMNFEVINNWPNKNKLLFNWEVVQTDRNVWRLVWDNISKRMAYYPIKS